MATAPAPTTRTGAPAIATNRSFTAGIVLALFFGATGIIDFYMGYAKTGFIKLLGASVASGVGAIGLALMNGFGSVAAQGIGSILVIVGAAFAVFLAIWVVVTFFQVVLRKGRYAADVNGLPLK